MKRFDSELLRSYVEEASEASFTELVHRHIDLVFSAALRTANGDSELARDVTQSVFVDLAGKARSLVARKSLSGWLYTSAHYSATKAVRSAQRRRDREQEAVAMQDNSGPDEVDWNLLGPVIERAMHQLPDGDREAILLRFFEKRELRSVGETLGISEEAARKKVHRAVERLRNFLAQRGITSSTASLAAALASYSVTAAPAHLATAIIPLALAGASTGWSALGTLLTMATTKTKAIVTGVVIAGTLATSVVQYQANRQLERENARLRETAALAEQLRQENDHLARSQQTSSEQERLQKERSELLKLRAEVTELRKQKRAGMAQAPNQEATNEAAAEPEASDPIRTFSGESEAILSSGQTLVTGGWSTSPGKRTLLLITPNTSQQEGKPHEVDIAANFADVSESAIESLGLGALLNTTDQEVSQEAISSEQRETILKFLTETKGMDVVSAPRVRTLSGRQARLEIGGQSPSLGTTLDLTPSVDKDGSTVKLQIKTELRRQRADEKVGE